MQMQTFVLQGSMIGRGDKNGPQGSGINEDVAFSLTAADRHAVAQPTYCTRQNASSSSAGFSVPRPSHHQSGKPCSLAHSVGEYRMWGNGIALPNAYFVLAGIVYYAQFPDFLL